jgi:deoxyribonuclease IV
MTEDTEAFSSWRVGIHTSIAESYGQAAEKAHQLRCTAFQIFSSSPRMWKARDPQPEEISALHQIRQRYDLRPLVVHANYLINLASPDPALRSRSLEAFQGEIGRASALGAEFLVLHPGSYRDGSPETGIRTLASSVREAARRTSFGGVTLLMENTCGQGNTLGGRFEELRDMLALLDGLPVDCCIDTAHCYAAGMDISTGAGLEKIISSLDETLGLGRVRVIHTNDSRSALGSHLDRHEHIGKGGIGTEGFRRIVNYPSLRDKTFILETPLDKPGDDRRNMEAILSLRSGAGQRPKSRKRAALDQSVFAPAMQFPPARAMRHGKANR